MYLPTPMCEPCGHTYAADTHTNMRSDMCLDTHVPVLGAQGPRMVFCGSSIRAPFFAPNLKTLDTCADRCDDGCSGQNRRDTDDHHCVHGYALGHVCRHMQKQMFRHEQTGVPLPAVRRTVMAVAIIPPRRISASTCT